MDSNKGRRFFDGQKVRVYLNITKKVFSVMALEGPDKGKVIAHTHMVALKGGCSFKVSQSGRKRVIKEGPKNVHAGVVGCLDLVGVVKKGGTRVSYNPKKYIEFTNVETGKHVFFAEEVYFENMKVFI